MSKNKTSYSIIMEESSNTTEIVEDPDTKPRLRITTNGKELDYIYTYFCKVHN